MFKEDKNPENSNSLNNDYHKVTSKLFYASLINIPIFAVPAFGALFLGKYLDSKFGSGKTLMIILLFVAFTFSWFMVLKRNAKIMKEYRTVREKMKQEKNKEN